MGNGTILVHFRFDGDLTATAKTKTMADYHDGIALLG